MSDENVEYMTPDEEAAEDFDMSDEEAAELAAQDEGGEGLPPDPDAEGLIPIVPFEGDPNG